MRTIADAILPESRTWGVLIDGPGGIGKTALAVRAGHLAPVAHFPRKIFLSAKVRELTADGEQPLEDFTLPKYLELLSELARELGHQSLTRSPESERAGAVRRVLGGHRALLVIDNVETFPEADRVRLYQFLSRLPAGCKALVTSRRRTDVDARIIRLDRLEQRDAFALLAEIGKTNTRLGAASQSERQMLYEVTGGNPLLLRWTTGQLGRRNSRCRTIPEACSYITEAPTNNNPLEYIFGDLLDTFTPSEVAALAALTHFTEPTIVKWIADLAGISERQVRTALEDLTARALLISDQREEAFYLTPLVATFLRNSRPEAVAATADRLAALAHTVALENGGKRHDRFPTLEAVWALVAAALPHLFLGDNSKLQQLCDALRLFLNYSGRWDAWLSLELRAEAKATASGDARNAGWRAYRAGWVYYLRGQSKEVLSAAARAEIHWINLNDAVVEKAHAIRLRGLGLKLDKQYSGAREAFQRSLELLRTMPGETEDLAIVMNSLGEVERASRNFEAADLAYNEALEVASKIEYQEGVGIIKTNRVALALEREDFKSAEQLALDALIAAETLGRQELIASTCQLLAKALARQGRPLEGLPHAERALAICLKLQKPDLLVAAQAAVEECKPKARVSGNA